MDKPERDEPEELQAEIGHIIHEVTGAEGEVEDQPIPVRDVYAFRQRIVRPDEPIEPSQGEQDAAAGGPPPPLPPPDDDLPDRP